MVITILVGMCKIVALGILKPATNKSLVTWIRKPRNRTKNLGLSRSDCLVICLSLLRNMHCYIVF